MKDLLIPEYEYSRIKWYGSWDQLIRSFDWCIKNRFLREGFVLVKEQWLQLYFEPPISLEKENPIKWSQIISTQEQYLKSRLDLKTSIAEIDPLQLKLSWHGTLESLIDYSVVLVKKGIIDEYRIRRWVADHFTYLVADEFHAINLNSLKVIWSRKLNPDVEEDKESTSKKRGLFDELLDELK